MIINDVMNGECLTTVILKSTTQFPPEPQWIGLIVRPYLVMYGAVVGAGVGFGADDEDRSIAGEVATCKGGAGGLT